MRGNGNVYAYSGCYIARLLADQIPKAFVEYDGDLPRPAVAEVKSNENEYQKVRGEGWFITHCGKASEYQGVQNDVAARSNERERHRLKNTEVGNKS